MAALEVHQFLCLSDNFGVLIHDPATNVTASVDAPDADAVSRALAERGWALTHILTTHHHADHTGGNAALKQVTGCTVAGPVREAARIPGIDLRLGEGDGLSVGAYHTEILETPGHTAGHITYWLPEAKFAFVGDTVFSLGCGRLFEGDASTMWTSISKIMRLPPETVLYCGHEYTLSNAEFALTVEPGNEALQARAREVRGLRERGEPTLPTTLAQELATNPFLRPDSPEIQRQLGMEGQELWEIFGEIRRRKDNA